MGSQQARTCQCPTQKGRNLVVCIDGTSNQFGPKNTNVVELYSKIVKGEEQLTYYNSGIGTYAKPSWKSAGYWLQVLDNTVDLAIAWNFESIVMGAYRWLSENYMDDDRIFLFGFSRGAYQVRALAGMIHRVGLIHKGNEEQIPFAYELYANHTPQTTTTANVKPLIDLTVRFKKTFSRENVHIHFVGVWYTVSSVGIVRGKTLPLTDSADHICFFRHALALDERRVKFLPEYVNGGSTTPGSSATVVQNDWNGRPRVKEVWFPGTHSDIGGGNRLNFDLDLGGTPFLWMSFEAVSSGLRLRSPWFEWPWEKSHHVDESLTYNWWIFEWLPIKRLSYKGFESTTNRWHQGQGREVLSGQKLHPSIAFFPKHYNPRAILPPTQQCGWDELVGKGEQSDRGWAVEWKDILEMDIFDYAIMPNVVEKLKSEQGNDNSIWIYGLTVISSTYQGREALLGVPNVMNDLVQMLSSPGSRTRKCVTDVLEGLEMFLYGESSGTHSDDLEEVIAYHREALRFRPGKHPGRCSSLNSLATYLQARFRKVASESTGGMDEAIRDLDDAIGYYREVLLQRPSDHPDYSISLTNVANAVLARYGQSTSQDDLEEAIKLYEEAAASRPPGHAGRSNNHAKALHIRFNLLGDMKDLQKAIKYHKEAIKLRPRNHPGRARASTKLATALHARYEQLGDKKDLDEAIKWNHEALTLRRSGDPDRSTSLNNLATVILARFEQLGSMEDLTAAIEYNYDALDLQPPSSLDRPMSLSNLANALLALYERLDDVKFLEDAIACYEDALSVYPPGHPGISTSTNNLSKAIFMRYEHSGDLEYLTKAIEYNYKAVELCPPGHLDRPNCLNNLANAIFTRYKQSRERKDLDKAIDSYRAALRLCPIGHLGRSSCLQNLATSLLACFNLLGSMDDLDEAIIHLREALDLRSSHPRRSNSLDSLANAVYTRFNKTQEMDHLKEVIEIHRETLTLRPHGHPGRFYTLDKLASAILIRHERLGSKEDLSEAIKHLREALDICPPDHPAHSDLLVNLDYALSIEMFGETGDLVEPDVIEQQICPSLNHCIAEPLCCAQRTESVSSKTC